MEENGISNWVESEGERHANEKREDDPMTDTPEDYKDRDGNPIALERLVREEPEWAVTRLRYYRRREPQAERDAPTEKCKCGEPMPCEICTVMLPASPIPPATEDDLKDADAFLRDCLARLNPENWNNAGWEPLSDEEEERLIRLAHHYKQEAESLADGPAIVRQQAAAGNVLYQHHKGALDHITTLEAALEEREETLQGIYNWAKAYPLDVFPEPDMKKAREGLASVGITLDAISASNMRHVITRLVEECALTQTEEKPE